MASHSATMPIPRKRTRSRIKRALPITPVALVVSVAVLLGGAAVAMTILNLTIVVLAMNLAYLALLTWVFIDQHRTGHSWNVPYPSQPEHYGRGERP